jgi:hypothetical protein
MWRPDSFSGSEEAAPLHAPALPPTQFSLCEIQRLVGEKPRLVENRAPIYTAGTSRESPQLSRHGCSTIHKPLFMHPKTYNALVRRLRQIEAKSGKCKSKYLTERTLKPNTMYQVELASIADL